MNFFSTLHKNTPKYPKNKKNAVEREPQRFNILMQK